MNDELIAELAVVGSESDRAASALGKAGDPAVIPYLLVALRRDAGWEDGSAACRKAAAIAAIGGDAAWPSGSGRLTSAWSCPGAAFPGSGDVLSHCR